MPKFRKKPVVIEAMQFTEAGMPAIFYWVGKASGSKVARVIYMDGDGRVYINTLEGQMLVSINDWVIQGISGEFYPCKPDIFEKTYEPEN